MLRRKNKAGTEKSPMPENDLRRAFSEGSENKSFYMMLRDGSDTRIFCSHKARVSSPADCVRKSI